MQTKSFFTIFFFLLALAMIVGGAMSGQDLTPNTPPAPETAASFNDGVPITNLTAAIPGGCGATFTVRSGDTLSAIARMCGVSLESLLAVNPAISNPHLIRPGQVVAIPGAAVVQPSVVQPAPVQPAAAQPVMPATQNRGGLVPGGSVHVTLRAMPPNTPVTIAIGKAGTIPLNVDHGQTDAQGGLSIRVSIPARAKTGEAWQVTVITDTKPEREYASPVFVIE